MIDEVKSINKVAETLNSESDFFLESKEQLNKGIDHIYQLITHAHILYSNGAFATSVFVSIATIEEVAKLHMGMFIKRSDEYVKKDRLRDHTTKEIIGSNYTVSMGERIKKAIPTKKLEELFAMSYSGKLKELREKAIYCERINGELVIPDDVINKEQAKNILLFAIESFDDNLVGYTKYSVDISKHTDEIFEQVANL